MAVKRCPNPRCRLISPVTATVCDCGRSFVDGTMTEQRRYLPGHAPGERTAMRNLALALGIGGLTAWLVSSAFVGDLPTVAPFVAILGFAAALVGWIGFFADLLRRR
jgi:hypothetical protein